MPRSIHHGIDVEVQRNGRVRRRDFLRLLGAAGGFGLASSLGWTERLGLASEALRHRGMRCVLLFMEGAPSQFETLDPKPESGSAPSIATSVPGIHLSENLPHLAKRMEDIAVIRSMTSREGSHARAQFLMHHGYVPMGGVQFPTLGSHVSDQIGNAAADLPSFVRIGGRKQNSGGAGFLDLAHDPLVLRSPDRPPQHTKPATGEDRFRRRLDLLSQLEADYAEQGGADIVRTRRQLSEAARDMILSPGMSAFDLDQEPDSVRAAYGEGRFAKGCLLARRLLEAGVTFVEVTQGGWDTHQDNHERVAKNCAQIDQPAAQLLADLKQRGMLETTLVIWMGEFGRTPKVNPRGGRDHYPKAFSAWLAGGGVAGGQVLGATDARGASVIDRPVTPKDLHQTIYTLLGIDPETEHESPGGRPIKLVDEGAPVNELIA